eukprot:996869-Rhodomonas_salina.1
MQLHTFLFAPCQGLQPFLEARADAIKEIRRMVRNADSHHRGGPKGCGHRERAQALDRGGCGPEMGRGVPLRVGLGARTRFARALEAGGPVPRHGRGSRARDP